MTGPQNPDRLTTVTTATPPEAGRGGYYVSFQLTVPPSANAIWKHGRHGSWLAPSYVVWIGENMSRAGPIIPVTGPVHVSSEVHGGKGWRINRDIDNTLKVQLDFLQRIKVIASDDCRTVKSVSVRYHEPETKKSAAYVILTVWASGAEY